MTRIHQRAAVARPCLALASTMLALLVSGCLTNPPKPDRTFQEAATVHIAPVSVARWEDYTDRLQPQFPISSTAALALAVPRTFSSQDAVASAFSAGLQVGPGFATSTSNTLAQTQAASAAQSLVNSGVTGSSNNSSTAAGANASAASAANTASTTVTTTVGSGSNASTTQTTTTQQTPATLPSTGLPAVTAPNAAGLATPSGSMQLDPMLQYTAAAAIQQEIVLLNSYVQDAALRYGRVPYVGRMQVSVSPLAHHLPYDAYVDISVFSTCNGADARPVILLPLLVTDDVETGQATNALSVARQLGLGLGATTGSVAFQAAVNDLKSQFKAILTNDFNSLFMVTRGLDNTLQVRLGAARNADPSAPYSMLTQTHEVSFVMLVDKKHSPDEGKCGAQIAKVSVSQNTVMYGGARVWVNSYTRLRNATTSHVLEVDRKAIRQRSEEVLARVYPDGDACVAKLLATDDPEAPERMLAAVQRNEVRRFNDELAKFSDERARCMQGQTRPGAAPSDTVKALVADAHAGDTTAFQNTLKAAGTADKDTAAALATYVDHMRQSLVNAAGSEDQESFKNAVLAMTGPAPEAQFSGLTASAWGGFATVVDMSEFAGTFLELPSTSHKTSAVTDNAPELVWLRDDCQAVATATVAGLGRLAPTQVRAELTLEAEEGSDSVSVAALSISQAAPGGPLTVLFPTLKLLGQISELKSSKLLVAACGDKVADAKVPVPAKPAPKKVAGKKAVAAKASVGAAADAPVSPLMTAKLTLSEKTDTRWADPDVNQQGARRVYAKLLLEGKAKTEDHSVTLASSGSIVLSGSGATAGTARVQIKLAPSLDDGVLSFTGGVLASVPANMSAVEKSPPLARLVVSSGYVDVPLQSLAVGQSVTFTVSGRKGGDVLADSSSSVTVPVVLASGSADTSKK